MDNKRLVIILLCSTGFNCAIHELKTTNWTMKSNEHFVKFDFKIGNSTHNGAISVDVFENIVAPTFHATITVNQQFELMSRTFHFCNFINAQNQNFVMNIFLSHVLNNVNKAVLKCPILKGSYDAVGETLKSSQHRITLPPFVLSGQQVHFDVVFKSIIKRKPEPFLLVTLDLIVT